MRARPRLVRSLVGGSLALLLAYLLFWPSPIDPETWRPPPAPGLTGPYADNQALQAVEWLGRGQLPAPEAIAFDGQGRLLTGLKDGRIMRLGADGKDMTLVAHTGGRPLGMKFDLAGNLIVCDAKRGLVAVQKDGTVTVLATAHGQPFRFPDDLAIAKDGIIYFTEASTRFTLDEFKLDLFEHRPHGRLYAYDPQSKRTELIIEGLYFANGIALFPDERSLLVVETSSYRVRRIWLEKGRRGQVETFIDNLPGFPDNITWSPDRRVFWLAIGSTRDKMLDVMGPRPFLRSMVTRLPESLQPAPRRHAFVLGLDEQGKVVANLQYAGTDAYAPIASVIEHGGWLYLGSFLIDGIGRAKAPP